MRRPSTALQPSRQHRSQTLGALLDAPGALRERHQLRAGLACVRAAPAALTEPLAAPELSVVVELRTDAVVQAQHGQSGLRTPLSLRPATTPTSGGGLDLDQGSSGLATTSAAADPRTVRASSVDARGVPLPPQVPAAAQPPTAADRFELPRSAPRATHATADGSVREQVELLASSPERSPVPQERVHDASSDTLAVRPTDTQSAPRRSAAWRKPRLPRYDEESNKAAMSKAERQLLAALGEAIPWHASDSTSSHRRASPL